MEVLVVVAILVITAAILLPVFSKAKFASVKSTDLQQVRQLGLACVLYAADNDDLYPLAADPISLNEYAQGNLRFGDARDDLLRNLPTLPVVLGPYVRNTQIFCSPFYDPAIPFLRNAPTRCQYYGVNYWYDDLRALAIGRFLASEPVLLSPGVLTHDDPNDLLDVYSTNCAFGDTHVRYLDARECINLLFVP